MHFGTHVRASVSTQAFRLGLMSAKFAIVAAAARAL
jgi:hypothetical protein